MHLHTDTQPAAERVKWISSVYHERLSAFLTPLLGLLDERLDRRLVHTFSLLVESIIRFRHRQHGLLLSELGAYLLSPAKAPAGTKRISNLLRSCKWQYGLLSDWLRAQAKEQLTQWPAQPVLLHWDESVVEKPESIHPEGLCPVRSAKARRLVRIRPGFFNPPLHRPVHVPGFQWLKELLKRRQHFILRWNKTYALVDQQARQLPCWQLVRGKRSLSKRLVKDTPRRCQRQMGLYYQTVFHPKWPGKKLSLIILRPGKGHAPLYLLTNLPVQHVNKAWRVVFCYARRWQVEAAFRYSKSELALESPRLWFWENRLKLMMILSVGYAFLLSLVQEKEIKQLLRWGCHRTGKRYQVALIPLYRIRIALMHIWTQDQSLNSG